jgi:hypothetical protein
VYPTVAPSNGHTDETLPANHHAFQNGLSSIIGALLTHRLTVGLYKIKGVRRPHPLSQLWRKALLEIVAPLEALDPSLRVHNTLLAGEEGMALAAYLYTKLFLRRAGCKRIPARTGNDGVLVELGMYIFLHVLATCLRPNRINARLPLAVAAGSPFELHGTIRESIQRMVSAQAHIAPRTYAGTSLPDYYGASVN